MYTIYFNNKPLFLVNDKSVVDDYLHREDTMFIDDFDSHTIKTMLYEMEQPGVHAGVFMHDDVDSLLTAFKKKFTLVKAAGGLVHRKKEILMIFRKGKWDLPKGKLDEGEDLESCAIREVKEETGLLNVQMQKPLLTTFHTYHENRLHILKESHWFLMKTSDKHELTPQTEEDIEKCEWLNIDDLSAQIANTYPLVKDVITKARTILEKH